ncbi:MAG TPA: hypothetical protein VF025_09410 [Gaiellaceae bacterium]
MPRLRSILIFKLGAIAGMVSAAAFAKGAMLSRGNEESDELSLVAVLDGIQLKSRATAFKGGSMLAWFGGISLDLRDAELASNARLSVRTLCGGIAIKTPPHWRLESRVTTVAGGVDVRGSADDAPEAPVLTVDGVALFGGIAAGASSEP